MLALVFVELDGVIFLQRKDRVLGVLVFRLPSRVVELVRRLVVEDLVDPFVLGLNGLVEILLPRVGVLPCFREPLADIGFSLA